MGILNRLLGRRSLLAHPRDPILAEWFGGPQTVTGQRVTASTALQVAAVYACVRILAESVASLPLLLYRRRPDGGKDRATDHPLYPLLHDAPNRSQTSFEWREMLMGHAALRGNAYAEILPAPGAGVDQLIPRHPDRVQPFRAPDGSLAYRYSEPDGSHRTILAEEMLHIRTLTDDGLSGLSPVSLHREAFGLAMATEEHGARLFTNGTQLGGILQHPGKLSAESAKRLRESWEARYAGVSNAHRTAILEEGMTWAKVGMTAEDAQFLESRAFQLEEIARIFRVPVVMLQHGDKTSTYASAEQFFLSFVVHSLTPWLTRWEQALNRALLGIGSDYFFSFLVEGLLRGDIKSRYAAYAIGRQWGWLSANDVRAMENQNPIEGGDIYLSPMNMIPAGTVGQEDPSNGTSPTA